MSHFDVSSNNFQFEKNPTNFWTVVAGWNQLVYFDVGGNYLAGSVPVDGLLNLSHLRYFDVSSNNLGGEYPHLPSGVLYRNYAHNSFKGPLPAISSSTTTIRLEGNNADRQVIPTSWEVAARLQILNVSDMLLTGVVPKFFSNFVRLTDLDLSGNSFTATCWPIVDISNYANCNVSAVPLCQTSDFPIPQACNSTASFANMKLCQCTASQCSDGVNRDYVAEGFKCINGRWLIDTIPEMKGTSSSDTVFEDPVSVRGDSIVTDTTIVFADDFNSSGNLLVEGTTFQVEETANLWISGNLTLDSTSVFGVSYPTALTGNSTAPSANVVVGGCLQLDGTLEVTFDQEVTSNEEIVFPLASATCYAGDFLEAHAINRNSEGCYSYSYDGVRTEESTLTAVFTVVDTPCQTGSAKSATEDTSPIDGWSMTTFVVIFALIGTVVIAGAIVAVLFVHPQTRRKLLPYRDREIYSLGE
eukprot:TRINITY_DN954_c0_g1_i2.p1 TRINITY_DN954_c0_g1~~TRINITY_DN954_c0_g1_i2.p1  ORF type:complete len:471 (-),score=33.36 TRINITY_DN954_c0_g1_i2:70-1482(-)